MDKLKSKPVALSAYMLQQRIKKCKRKASRRKTARGQINSMHL